MSMRVKLVECDPPLLVFAIPVGPDGKCGDDQFCVEVTAQWYIGGARGSMSDVLVRDVLPKLVKTINSHQELVDTVQNLLGAFDTPLRRAKMPSDFGDEVCQLARELPRKLEER